MPILPADVRSPGAAPGHVRTSDTAYGYLCECGREHTAHVQLTVDVRDIRPAEPPTD